MSLKCCLSVVALAAAASTTMAQPVVFTQWDFSNSAFQTGTQYNSPTPTTGSGTATPLGMTNSYTDSNGLTGCVPYCDVLSSPDNINASFAESTWRVRGDNSITPTHTNGWNLAAPQYTQGAQFSTSTLGLNGIVLTFDWYSTTQGVRNMQIQYTADGSTWHNVGPVLVAESNGFFPNACARNGGAGIGVTVDFGALGIHTVDGNPNFGVRMVSVYDPNALGGPKPLPKAEYASATSTYDPTCNPSGSETVYNNNSGNWRFGNVTFSGTANHPLPIQISAAASTLAVCNSVGGSVIYTGTVQPGVNPTSTGISVTADLSSVGGSATQQLYDDGTHGDAVAGDNVFTYAAVVPAGLSLGLKTINMTVTDTPQPLNGQPTARTASASTTTNVVDCTQNSSSTVVISQVYGGGGNVDSNGIAGIYNADYVELYNRSNQTVNLSGWSVEYAGATSADGFSSTGTQVPLSGVIKPGQYLLIQMSDPVPGFPPLPTPDFQTTYGLGGIGNSGGRVALVSSTALIGTNCSAATVQDLVGYGPTAICYEGGAPTQAPYNPTAVVRAANGAQDTNQNFYDFSVGSPNPRNRAVGFLAGYPSISNAAACAGSVVDLYVQVTPGPTSTGITVHADVSSVVGSPTTVQLYDDGTHGDATPGDGIYTLAYTIPNTAAQAVDSINFTVADAQGHTDPSSVTLAVGQCVPASSPVVFSKIYGGGGNNDSGYNDDCVEIFNRSSAPVDLTGWSYQYAKSTDIAGFSTSIVPLSGTIQPGEYLLIAAKTTTTGTPVPTPDFTANPSFGMDNQFAIIALCNTTAPQGTNFTSPAIIDFVGYGISSQYYRGIGPTGTLSDLTIAVRKQGGCQDYNQNSIDFDILVTTAENLPNNSASPFNVCPVATGTCCKGSTCLTGVAPSACTGADTLFVAGGTSCNASGNRKTPCCEADFNHVGGITVQDIFDFLSAWFAKNPIANITSNGAGAPTVQSIFDFLSAWFAKGC